MTIARRTFLYLVGLAGLAPVGAHAAPAEPESFSYCVGRPWPVHLTLGGYDPEHICVYAYGTQVQHGSMADAKRFRKQADANTGEGNRIYKLVRVG